MILILMSSKNIKKNNDNLVNKLNNLSINHRYKIKSLNLVSSWSFITPKNSNCPICHQNLNTNSLSAKEKGIHSYVVEGKCGHCYHNECIEKWTTKYSKNTNPKKYI